MGTTDDATLDAPLDSIDDRRVVVGTPAFLDADFDTRYARRARIGEGGMGEILSCWDRRIGREIAMKVLREGHAKTQTSGFMFEARVQGQLEHPSVVPVYDMGVGGDGNAFFTMKRVIGVTLEDVIERLRRDEATSAYSRRKLLSAFASVCLAVDFAHARGVVHCDLKPANVMLGDYGEVYVLDWGIAQVARESSVGKGERLEASPTAPGFMPGIEKHVRGTPGYMAPEQLDPNAAIDARTDVFALGAILYEILTLEPIVQGDDVHAMLSATLAGVDAHASVRAPDREVPPELEAACVRATASSPSDRFTSARAFHDAVEHFLEGDRDLELRRTLAERHVEVAEQAAARALAGGAEAEAERSRALREAGRALAFDPKSARAIRVVTSLLTAAPDAMPDAARAEFEAATRISLRSGFRLATYGLLSWYLLLIPLLWMGIREWTPTLAAIGMIGVSILLMLVASRMQRSERIWWLIPLTATLLVGTTSRIVGPLMVTPWLAIGTIATLSLLRNRLGVALLLTGVVMVAAPLALELLGALPESYAFRDGAMVVLPHMTELPRVPTLVFVTGSACITILVTGFMMARYRDELTRAQQRLHVQAWHLRQLAPEVTDDVKPRAAAA